MSTEPNSLTRSSEIVSGSKNPQSQPPRDVPVNLPNPDYYKKVHGWGIDIDKENDPTYPVKPNRTDDEQKGSTWERPPQQPINMEVLHSIERPGVSAVFGTSAAPSGLSGVLRRYAFQFTESNLGHWLPLVLADRINVVEGYLDDFAHGYFPNVFAERGWGAEWKHDPDRVMRKVAVGAVVAAAAITVLCRKSNSRHSR